MNFDSIAPIVDQYFKIYQLKEMGLITVEVEDFLIAEAEKGRTAFSVLEEIYSKDKSKENRKLFDSITLIEKESPSGEG